ncbi:MAG: hypothetical protein AB7O43_08895 [Hyphomicrobiaceae bacterium]
MKSFVIGLSAAALCVGFAGSAMAAPGKHGFNRVTLKERVAVAKSAAKLAQVKRGAWADGRLTRVERMRIRVAEARHRAIVARAHR